MCVRVIPIDFCECPCLPHILSVLFLSCPSYTVFTKAVYFINLHVSMVPTLIFQRWMPRKRFPASDRRLMCTVNMDMTHWWTSEVRSLKIVRIIPIFPYSSINRPGHSVKNKYWYSSINQPIKCFVTSVLSVVLWSTLPFLEEMWPDKLHTERRKEIVGLTAFNGNL